jgi:hypothetical protein
MQTEETVGILKVGRKATSLLHLRYSPGGSTRLVTVTVGEVVHELSIVDTKMFVNLPEDDGTVTGGAKAVALSGMAHLALRKVASANNRLTELGGNAKTAGYERGI